MTVFTTGTCVQVGDAMEKGVDGANRSEESVSDRVVLIAPRGRMASVAFVVNDNLRDGKRGSDSSSLLGTHGDNANARDVSPESRSFSR